MSAMRKADCRRLRGEEKFCVRGWKGLEEGDKRREERRRKKRDHDGELYHLRLEIPLDLPLHARPPSEQRPSLLFIGEERNYADFIWFEIWQTSFGLKSGRLQLI